MDHLISDLLFYLTQYLDPISSNNLRLVAKNFAYQIEARPETITIIEDLVGKSLYSIEVTSQKTNTLIFNVGSDEDHIKQYRRKNRFTSYIERICKQQQDLQSYGVKERISEIYKIKEKNAYVSNRHCIYYEIHQHTGNGKQQLYYEVDLNIFFRKRFTSLKANCNGIDYLFHCPSSILLIKYIPIDSTYQVTMYTKSE